MLLLFFLWRMSQQKDLFTKENSIPIGKVVLLFNVHLLFTVHKGMRMAIHWTRDRLEYFYKFAHVH